MLAWTGLKLNAVVMVNLIMSMGIAVEFLAHIARAFMLAQGTRRGIVSSSPRASTLLVYFDGFFLPRGTARVS